MEGAPMSKQEDNTISPIASHATKVAGDITPEPLTSETIKKIAALGLNDPSRISQSQIQKLCGSVLAHIEPRKG